jgi:CDP-2,3-bis-(O-geranylgeranyl)-sn-glycerol synthase
MLHDISFSLWFLLPAAVANVVPIFIAVIPGLNKLDAPIDGGRMYRGRELLGKHKTWRGFIIGIIASTSILGLQQFAYCHYGWGKTASGAVDYSLLPLFILGPLFGLGALGGDAIESFFKRQRGVASGSSWMPFDQLDYIIGGVLVTLPFVRLTPIQYIWIFILWFGIHLLASYGGYLVGLKKSPI